MRRSPQDSDEYRLNQLSTREREVLELAVLGRQDEMISQALGITLSTVNSYWVRIRAKVGQLSRTEIVGLVLRYESDMRHAGLTAENARLMESERQGNDERAQLRSDLRATRGSDWHLLALDHMPYAAVVCRPPGHVIYANLQAQHIFAAEPGEFHDIALSELTIPEDRPARQAALSGFFVANGPRRVVVGVEQPFHGLRRDGTNFRSIMVAERFVGPEGMMSVATFRDTMEDIDALLEVLRRPFVIG